MNLTDTPTIASADWHCPYSDVRPSDRLCALLQHAAAPPVIAIHKLCGALGVLRGNWLKLWRGKRVTRVAAAHGWTVTSARDLGLSGKAHYLVKAEYRNSLWRQGVTARGRVYQGHEGTGRPPIVADIEEWARAHGLLETSSSTQLEKSE